MAQENNRVWGGSRRGAGRPKGKKHLAGSELTVVELLLPPPQPQLMPSIAPATPLPDIKDPSVFVYRTPASVLRDMPELQTQYLETFWDFLVDSETVRTAQECEWLTQKYAPQFPDPDTVPDDPEPVSALWM